MREFFRYESPYRTNVFMELSKLEFFMPIILLASAIFLLIYFRKVFINNKTLDRRVRYTVGIIFMMVYLSHYGLRFYHYGFDKLLLPFQLCSISMFLAIILIFTKNRTVYTFVLFAGVLGGIISLFTPIIGYDSTYYRYYQFYIAHSLLIITPIYFMVVHNYFPTKRSTIQAFLILQSLAIFMGVFNYFLNTDFLFIFVDPAKLEKFPAIKMFGGIPYYLILVEITGIIAFYLMFKLTTFICKLQNPVNEIKYRKA